MDNHQSTIFVINEHYHYFSTEHSNMNRSGSMSSLNNIELENTIAYIDALHFNLIPELLYNDTKIDSYLKLTTEKLTGITPVTNKVPQLNSVLLWTLDETIKKTLIVNSPGITFCHLMELFLNETVNQNTKSEIKLRLTDNTIYILCFKKGKLQLGNRFAISGEEDAIYYTLLCADHSEINKENTLVNIKGVYKEKVITQIKKYFKPENISIGNEISLQSFIK